MSETNLKPCPFCGGEAEMKMNHRTFLNYVKCKICGSKSKEAPYGIAKASWNIRKPMERIAEQLEDAKSYSVSPQFNKGIDMAIEIIQKEGAE